MAEFVEFRAEEWIPELEQMERNGLFTAEEIKTIAKKRRDFEYKIQKRSHFKEDYLRYIQFEMDLHTIVRGKRERLNILANKAEIDHALANRVAKLFKQAIFRFQEDVRLWISYFKFCKQMRFHNSESRMLVRMLQVHSDKPSLWKFAADWEFEECNSVESARQFLLRGLRYHASSKVLYTEAFRLELEYAQIKRKERDEKAPEWIPDQVTDHVIKGRLAEVVYESAVKKIQDIDFVIGILSLAKNYPDTLDLQTKIFQDLMAHHSNNELTWDTMAKREFEGLSCTPDPSTNESRSGEPVEIDLEKEVQDASLKGRIQKSVDIYELAVKKLNTEKMWSLYLEHLIDLNNDTSTLPIFKSKLLRQGMEEAIESGHMGEKYYLHWADVLTRTGGKHKKLAAVLKSATEQHSNSVILWQSRLRFHLRQDHEKMGMLVFKEAIEKLTDCPASDVMTLWKMVLMYFQTKSKKKVEDVFQDGLKRGGDIRQLLKPMYIEWVVLTKGIGSARRIFETTDLQHPPCLELLTKMAALEAIQPDASMKAIRRCHELACTHFGKNSADVWMDYVKFEFKFGEPSKISQIYHRAMKDLEPSQADIFSAEFSIYKVEV